MAEKKSKTQVISVWCPNCGIPRNARVTLKKYIAQRGRVRFFCPACNLNVEIGQPTKKKKDDEGDISLKDITKATKVAKLIGKGLA